MDLRSRGSRLLEFAYLETKYARSDVDSVKILTETGDRVLTVALLHGPLAQRLEQLAHNQ